MRLEKIEDMVWCDVHGDTHAETNDPYGYHYDPDDPDDQPECGPEEWRKIWMGGYIK